MATIANLVIGVSADAAKFNKELDGVRKQIDRFKSVGGIGRDLLGSKSSVDLASKLTENLKDINPILDRAASGFQFMLSGMQEAADSIREMRVEADKLGVSVNTVFELQHVKNGEALIPFLKKLQQDLGEAAMGSDEARKKFEKLGLSWRDMVNEEGGEQLRIAADRIAEAKTAAERASIAAQLGGKGGKEAVGILSQGRAGLDKAAARAHTFVSEQDIENAERFGGTIKFVKKQWEELWIWVNSKQQQWEDLKTRAFGTAEDIAAMEAERERVRQRTEQAAIVEPQGKDNLASKLLADMAAAADTAMAVSQLNKELEHHRQELILGADEAKLMQKAWEHNIPAEELEVLNAKLRENKAIQQQLSDRKGIAGVFENLSDQLNDIGGKVGDKAIAKLLQLGATVEQLDAADAGFALIEKLKMIESLKSGSLPQANVVGSSGAISAMNKFRSERNTQGLQDRLLEEIKRQAEEQNAKLADILDELKDPKIKRADI